MNLVMIFCDTLIPSLAVCRTHRNTQKLKFQNMITFVPFWVSVSHSLVYFV